MRAPKGNPFTTVLTVFLKVVQCFNLIRWPKYRFQRGFTFLCTLLRSRNALAISQFLPSRVPESRSGITINSFAVTQRSRDCEGKQCYLLFSVFLILLHWIFQSSGQQTNYLLTKETNKRVHHINWTVSLKIFLLFCSDTVKKSKFSVKLWGNQWNNLYTAN